MSALDYLLAAPDPFTLLGMDRRFEVDLVLLEQRYGQLADQVRSLSAQDPVKSAQVLEKLAESRRVLSNPVTRGDHLLRLHGGAADAPTEGLPPGFRDKLEVLRRTRAEDEVAAERQRVLGIVDHLFHLLGSADNAVVKRERRRQVREALNAVRELDQL